TAISPMSFVVSDTQGGMDMGMGDMSPDNEITVERFVQNATRALKFSWHFSESTSVVITANLRGAQYSGAALGKQRVGTLYPQETLTAVYTSASRTFTDTYKLPDTTAVTLLYAYVSPVLTDSMLMGASPRGLGTVTELNATCTIDGSPVTLTN